MKIETYPETKNRAHEKSKDSNPLATEKRPGSVPSTPTTIPVKYPSLLMVRLILLAWVNITICFSDNVCTAMLSI